MININDKEEDIPKTVYEQHIKEKKEKMNSSVTIKMCLRYPKLLPVEAGGPVYWCIEVYNETLKRVENRYYLDCATEEEAVKIHKALAEDLQKQFDNIIARLEGKKEGGPFDSFSI